MFFHPKTEKSSSSFYPNNFHKISLIIIMFSLINQNSLKMFYKTQNQRWKNIFFFFSRKTSKNQTKRKTQKKNSFRRKRSQKSNLKFRILIHNEWTIHSFKYLFFIYKLKLFCIYKFQKEIVFFQSNQQTFILIKFNK